MIEYAACFYEWHGAASERSLDGLSEVLNKYAGDGWALFDVKPVSIGYMVIFERAATDKAVTVTQPANAE